MVQLQMRLRSLENLPDVQHADYWNIHTLQPGSEATWEWITHGAFKMPISFNKAMRADECFDYERIFMAQQFAQDTATAAAWHRPQYGEHTGYLHYVATHPTCQGEGAGLMVTVAALKKMRELGYTDAVLRTDDERLAAIAMYKQLGFEPDTDSPELKKTIERWQKVEEQLMQSATRPAPKLIPLWQGDIPMWDDSITDQYPPTLKPFVCGKSRGAVVVCPGGGYTMKAAHEGDPIARMINEAGVSAFVLDYRVAPYHFPAPILDVNRAVKVVRSLGYEKVGVLGFSAGGHLTAMSGVHYDLGKPEDADPIERLSSRPDAIAPCYGVISFAAYTHWGSREFMLGANAEDWEMVRYLSAELQVNADTPSVFMWHTADDGVVPIENSLMLAKACADNKVECELHVFPHGPHGMGLAGGTAVNQWTTLCQTWLKGMGFGQA